MFGNAKYGPITYIISNHGILVIESLKIISSLG
jgi:hypothetical protein